ncbi:uncharacterized protein LOC130895699 isoform X2 [Diorhabda carinulata]|uniref:uncharacterized protein LOC130895699 isoform X1 n=1 Tax=Diorhabda carinulata TaxID=1163345 RepID=UPI0025A10255|nr:uncharacterized protein LOC130895699 isoform X1 [Diorhabda carinulata]XP_057659154.1 uncharacterized protein LOC130895699 isoform X2 [Diorhabda carinulata]
MPREKSSLKGGTVSGDGSVTPIRKERLSKSKKELAEEAKRVLHQVDRVDCISSPQGVDPEKFYTLQNRKKKKEYFSGSLDRKRKSIELVPPKKPPRTFAATKYSQKPSVFDIFKKEKPALPKKSNLRRTVSDLSTTGTKYNDNKFRKRSGSDSEEFLKRKNEKKQLSPIIEVTQREDYFSAPELDNDQNKENVEPKGFVRKKKKESIAEQLKQFIDEVDEEIYKETGVRVPPTEEQKLPQPVIIDVEKAEQISNKEKKFKHSVLARKLKSITRKKKPPNEADKNKKNEFIKKKHAKIIKKEEEIPNPIIKKTINNLTNPKDSPKMIHSSQMPPEKPPLTKGRKVNTLVKRLSNESTSPPPLKTNVVISPHNSVQHNNNQPFSYTRGLSPDKSPSKETSPTAGSPIIYAQVICGNNGNSYTKQTIHTSYNKKNTHSDSDEGLGYEEHVNYKTLTKFGEDYDEVDKYQEENPITPKFKNPAYLNGYSTNEKEQSPRYLDSSARGRGDGMDSKRKTEIFESQEQYLTCLSNNLTARRDQLESRINRRVTDNSIRTSPEYLKNTYPTNVYIYKNGTASPDKYGKPHIRETKYVQYIEEQYQFDNEPKSFDSQISSSPENRRYNNISRSNQDSLRRRTDSYNYRYEENDRRERFVDSGIENDFRKESTDNFRSRSRRSRKDYCNESEDEGFASSLLIASERQHTEENIGQRRHGDYDSDRAVSREDDPYRHVETMDYKSKVNEYIPRERSIDDGSHYDPRIDKSVEVFNGKKSEKKPPRPEKKSGLDKVKSLFSRDTKKKKEKVEMVPEENLRARYIEYKGRGEPVGYTLKKQEIRNHDYVNRRRLSTPSPSPTREHRNVKTESTNGSWFKSLDRLSRKKSKKGEKELNFASGTEEETPTKPTKNLRFFGDTDQESNDSIRHKTSTKPRSRLPSRNSSQSTRDLHNISEEFKAPRSRYKSMTNVSETERESRSSKVSLKPPMSPNHRTPRDVSRQDKDRPRRRKNEVSSVESSTEGESSQQSQRSVVYLHAATVGDIPGPGYMKNGRRAASREELASNASRVQQVKTLSRSFSVLAPWRPRSTKDNIDIDYTQYSKNGKSSKFEQKASKSPSHRKENSSTLKKKAQESKKKESTLNKISKSKENLSSHTLGRSRDDLSKGSNSTLYKKKDRLPRENSRYNREKEEKKISSKSLSVESLSRGERRNRDISRSVSMPRDPEKSAGWFKISKKSKMNSVQRL